MVKVLFVCLGNICRSPMAESIFKQLVQERQLSSQISTDSAGIQGWHVGKSPDRRTLEVLSEHNIETSHVGQKLSVADLTTYNHIAVMDEANFEAVYNFYYENLNATPPARKLFLIRDFDPEVEGVQEVQDPYYEDKKVFRKVFDTLRRSCNALIDYIVEEHNLTPEEPAEDEYSD
ncbi:MAG: low molecular weight phosphotyrosine protein phosphatase [Spirosomaceae bacterium]|nr:low molecular weight phosphotyrosine protein phosphatase [Spirosomataceae bacterium]